jgi:hypothetical protein
MLVLYHVQVPADAPPGLLYPVQHTAAKYITPLLASSVGDFPVSNILTRAYFPLQSGPGRRAPDEAEQSGVKEDLQRRSNGLPLAVSTAPSLPYVSPHTS